MADTKDAARAKPRRAMSRKARQLIWDKTGGHCHVCGGEILPGDFQIDHVVPKERGGGDSVSNLLPIHGDCNKMRSAQRPEKIRDTLRIGIAARREMINGTPLGNKLWRHLKVVSKLRATTRKSAKPPVT